jgi:tetratricopeptide (TPR) repeat protein
MRSVLDDPTFVKHAGRFVWLAINFDQPENKPIVDQYAARGIPVLLILDAGSERVLKLFSSDTTKAELERFFVEAEQLSPAAPREPAAAAVARAEALIAQDRAPAAADEYARALELGGPGWRLRAQTIAARAGALQRANQLERCAALAVKEAPAMPREVAFGDLVLTGLGCSLERATWAKAARPALEPLAKEAVTLAAFPSDSRYQLYEFRVAARELEGDPEGVKRAAGEWLTRVESDDRDGPRDPDSLVMRDAVRVRAAHKLGDPARTLPALIASTKAMPAEFTASARLATMANEAGETDLTLSAVEKGLTLSPSPEGRASLLADRAIALSKKGDRVAALQALDQAELSARQIPAERKARAEQARLARLREQLSRLVR